METQKYSKLGRHSEAGNNDLCLLVFRLLYLLSVIMLILWIIPDSYVYISFFSTSKSPAYFLERLMENDVEAIERNGDGTYTIWTPASVSTNSRLPGEVTKKINVTSHQHDDAAPTSDIPDVKSAETSLSSTKKESEDTKLKIGLCYGILYGNMTNYDNIIFWVKYYQRLGVSRIISYMHPTTFEADYKIFDFTDLDAFELSPWPDDYNIHEVLDHRSNHYKALEMCYRTLRMFDWVIVADTDEFLYFDPNTYETLPQFLIRYDEYSQIYLERLYYEIDICYKVLEKPTIWDLPYNHRGLARTGKSIMKPGRFIDFFENKTVHFFHVDGPSKRDLQLPIAHFKHYRRFAISPSECKQVSNAKEVKYQEDVDLLDPAQKDLNSQSKALTFVRDKSLEKWKDFINV